MGPLYDLKPEPTGLDEAIAAVAASQHGLFTRDQAVAVGATRSAIRWRVATGRWERLHPSVYRLAGAPDTWRQRMLAACLHWGSGTVAADHCAALLIGLVERWRGTLEVLVPGTRSRSSSAHIKVRRTKYPLPLEDVTALSAIPVTTPARTLLDLATIEPLDVAGRYLDTAIRKRKIRLKPITTWLEDPRRARHPGARRLRTLVDDRIATSTTESDLEDDFLDLLREEDLSLPLKQHVIRDELGRFVGRADFAYPTRRIAIELDSFEHHDTHRTFDTERARGNEIELLGWQVLRITARHMREDPQAVVRWIERALRPSAAPQARRAMSTTAPQARRAMSTTAPQARRAMSTTAPQARRAMSTTIMPRARAPREPR